MGVPGVFQLVSGPIARNIVNLNDHEKLRIAVDVSSWLCQACFGHGDLLAEERALSRYGQVMMDTQQPQQPPVFLFITSTVQHVLRRLQILRRKHTVLVVLDGKTPPAKARQVQHRRDQRQAHVQLREAPPQIGEDVEARFKANKRAGAGPVLYSQVLESLRLALREQEIPFVVAPYEADGQLVWLRQRGWVDLIVTEDSDLLAYEGASPVLYKVADSLKQGDVPSGKLILESDWVFHPQLAEFTPTMLCVLMVACGSDYAAKLKGIGPKTAIDVLQTAMRSKEPWLGIVIEELWQRAYDRDGWDRQDFEDRFLEAIVAYQHPVVYDPVRQATRYLGDDKPDPHLARYRPYRKAFQRRREISGPLLSPDVATLVAEGWISAKTEEPYQRDGLPPAVAAVLDKRESGAKRSTITEGESRSTRQRCEEKEDGGPEPEQMHPESPEAPSSPPVALERGTVNDSHAGTTGSPTAGTTTASVVEGSDAMVDEGGKENTARQTTPTRNGESGNAVAVKDETTMPSRTPPPHGNSDPLEGLLALATATTSPTNTATSKAQAVDLTLDSSSDDESHEELFQTQAQA